MGKQAVWAVLVGLVVAAGCQSSSKVAPVGEGFIAQPAAGADGASGSAAASAWGRASSSGATAAPFPGP